VIVKRLVLLALAPLVPFVTPAFAQAMDPAMPGMDHAVPHAPAPDAAAPSQPVPAPGDAVGTDQSPGSAEPPPVAHDRPADRYFDPQAMARAEAAMIGEGSAATYSQFRLDLAEVQLRKGHDGYRWEGEAWTGDLDRFVFRSKGEGTFRQGIDSAELQAVYSHALDPWWNLQVGVRQDIRPTPARSYATIGIEGMAPYKFDVLAAAFLSDKGQLTARLEASVDEHLTRRFVLQPRLELNLSAQDMPAQRLGAGLNSAELGVRLRYEISRQFAPYIGLESTWATGRTADYARADGDSPHRTSVMIGFSGWF